VDVHFPDGLSVVDETVITAARGRQVESKKKRGAMRQILRVLQGGRLTAVLLVLLAVAALTPAAQGQGCTMCYTAAAQQSAQGKHALDVGILVLLTPALGIFCGVFFFVWRSKESQGSDQPKPALETVSGFPPVIDWERAGDNEEELESWPNERS
jgi:H+/Cl- antiporter ClcA